MTHFHLHVIVVSFLRNHLPCFLRQNLQLGWNSLSMVDWMTNLKSSYFCFLSGEITNVHYRAWLFYMGSGSNQVSCLYRKPFTDWATFLAPIFINFLWAIESQRCLCEDHKYILVAIDSLKYQWPIGLSPFILRIIKCSICLLKRSFSSQFDSGLFLTGACSEGLVPSMVLWRDTKCWNP